MHAPRMVRAAVLAGVTAMLAATPAAAHVKWFSEFSFQDSPRGVGQVVGPAFIALAVLSVIVVAGMVPLDAWLRHQPWYQRLNGWLEARAGQSRLVMRVGTGAVLLLAWQADLVLLPDLPIAAAWEGWLQFFLALLLLFEATTAIAGAGLLLLFGLGVARAGLYYMLDYVLVLGIGYYLIVTGSRSARLAGSGLPALYLTVGFSLCWVALEKLVWPEWGLYVLQQNPQLAMGLDLRFFLTAAAFIEFCLGYLLIINLLQRPLALVITLVFFTTTMVFGKTEVIGHTLIHAALVVFILEGPGTVFRPPIALHRRMGLRTAFAAVNLVVLLAVMLPLYAWGAEARHRAALRNPAPSEAGPDAPPNAARGAGADAGATRDTGRGLKPAAGNAISPVSARCARRTGLQPLGWATPALRRPARRDAREVLRSRAGSGIRRSTPRALPQEVTASL
jgi:hypothetical protein